jgi:DNA-binding MarR family transcriptional regulator
MKEFADETTVRNGRVAGALVELGARVVQLVRAEVRQRATPGLPYSQIRSLRFLRDNPHAALSEVAEGLGLGAPTVSKAINGLVEQGMVERAGDCADRRRVKLELTAAGLAALREASEVAHARIGRMLAPLTEDEVRTVENAIRLLEPLFAPDAGCGGGEE